jgi:protein gp37
MRTFIISPYDLFVFVCFYSHSGESGPGARPMDEGWVLDLRRQAKAAGIPFFFKQWGGVFKKRRGRILQGRLWDERPESPIAVNS